MNPNLKKRNCTPFFVLFAAFFLFHCLMPHIRDDIVIEQGMDFTSISFDYIRYLIISKYGEWSSRIWINVMTLVMGKLPHLVWIFCDSIMTVLAAWSIFCLTKEADRDEKKEIWFIIALFFLYPFSHMATAGWKATTITYWWTLACGLYAMIPIQRQLQKETILWWEYPLFLLAALYGANQEQMSAVLTGVYGCSLIFLFWKIKNSQEKQKQKTILFLVILFLISFAGFLFALLCPGNGVRIGDETAVWFADYGRITWIQKLEIGISSAGYELFYQGNLCFLVLAGILFWLVQKDYSDWEYRVIAAVPLVTCLVTGVLFPLLSGSLPGLGKWKEALTSYGTITVENYTERFSYLPLIWIGVVIGCLLVTFYLVFENRWKALAMCVIFLIGYASRVVLGFSPTVWASSYRTYLFLYMAVIVLAVFGYQEGIKRKIWTGWSEQILYVMAGVAFASQIFGV